MPAASSHHQVGLWIELPVHELEGEALPGPEACIPFSLLLSACQVTHVCALSGFGILLCGGPRLFLIQGLGDLFCIARSAHIYPGPVWHIPWGQEDQIHLSGIRSI